MRPDDERIRLRRIAAVFGALAFSVPCVGAGGAQGRADGREGWLLGASDGSRRVDLVVPFGGLALGEGESIHPELRASDTAIELAARVQIGRAGSYEFNVETGGVGRQEYRMESDGAVSMEGSGTIPGLTTSLRRSWAAPSELEVSFVLARGSSASIRCRATWAAEEPSVFGFSTEPIPPRFARAPPSEACARTENALAGRILLERKGCTNCHATDARVAHAVGRRPAPDLSAAGARISAEWIEAWLADPAGVRPACDMPDVLAARSPEAVRAVAAFVSALGLEPTGAGAAPPGSVERGRALYHRVGCVACHGPLESPAAVLGDAYLGEEAPAVEVPSPFGAIDGKWRRAALASFLLEPTAAYPDGRMPSLGLGSGEAADIAAYLAGRFGRAPDRAAPDASRVARGRALFAESGCAACHALAGIESRAPRPPALAEMAPGGGCLDPARSDLPRYALDEGERSALVAGIESAQAASGDPAPLDRLERALAALNCRACHAMDGQGGVPADLRVYFASQDERADLGDEARIPPSLDGAGTRLTTAWMHEVLVGGERARPYLAARMPRYAPSLVQELPALFAKRVGLEPGGDRPAPEPSDELVAAGRELMGREALACVSCHAFRDYPLVGAPGPDLSRLAHRLRGEWFSAFLGDPSRYLPGTRMPTFASGGRSAVDRVLGGDAARQIEAMWAYLSLGDAMPVPPDVDKGRSLQLVPQDRPVVVRTFLESAGQRAIAVGSPNGLHYAYDAEACRLVEAWRGDFLDAAGIWAGRGGTPVGGRGPVVWTAPEGPLFEYRPAAAAADPSPSTEAKLATRFQGYRLETDGTPVFRYELSRPPFGSVRVQERVDPGASPAVKVQCRFEVRGSAGELWFPVGTWPGEYAFEGDTKPSGSSGAGEPWLRLAVPSDGSALRFSVTFTP